MCIRDRYISDKFRNISSEKKIILVTEKDASRLVLKDIDEEIRKYLYYLPIEVAFMDKGDDFEDKILKHVEDSRFKLN